MMIRNNLENPIFLYILLILIVTVNTISSIHFLLIMLSGVLFNAFYICLKKRYLYSLFFVIITFLFVEINSGLKPFSLVLLSFFLYVFVIPQTERLVSFSRLNNYLHIVLFYIGVFITWELNFENSDGISLILLINMFIDLIFFGLFI
ncbi:hypothetical protein GCM10012288_10060 [Malaciobacter pacificus]|uniref:Putative membrane protein n=1 Tax=Malaciobacter pacificus TaxID=1080223 RepID=A0A5C2H5Z2_9BACT|nr:hypothetical protein [Malaciobacter pacificus]QEP34381.1 putative membrane protein [Malaciobacter pacificus]GGD37951.1 hypothetical protein GCM10012288_10060 [Malaciobacter pacificus]